MSTVFFNQAVTDLVHLFFTILNQMKKIQHWIKNLFRFIAIDLWHLRLDTMSRTKSFMYRNLRIIVIAIRGFREDECRFRASALTYYSLMAIIPILAVAFAIAKGFGFESSLQGLIMERFAGNEEIITTLTEFANRLIDQTHGGLIAGIGLVVLIWAIMEVFSHIEHSFNTIWQQKKGRSLGRRFSDYLSLMLVAPVLIIISGSATVFISGRLSDFINNNEAFEMLGPFLIALIRWFPIVMIWIIFTLIYLIMPNTRVKFKPALIGALIAGTIYQIIQIGYFVIQIKLIDMNAVYGSFAALPLLFLWLRTSWVILLLGAEISYAHQNVSKYEYETESINISLRFRKIVSLMIVRLIAKRFQNAEIPITEAELAHRLHLPLKLVRQSVFDLTESGVICEAKTKNDRESAYLPATDVHYLSIAYVLDKIEKNGATPHQHDENEVISVLHASLKEFSESLNGHPDNKLLIEI